MTDHSSERALLEHIVQDPDWTRRNASRISTALFGKEHHRLIFEAVCGLEKWDMMSVVSLLRARGSLEKVGGAGEVTDLFVSMTVPSMADWHLERAREDALLRRYRDTLKDSLEKLDLAAQTGVEDAAALVAGIRERLEGAGNLPGRRLKRLSSSEAMDLVVNELEERAKNPGKIKGITTGLPSLDKKTHGLQEGHLWVIAGGPGDGKSVIMQNLLEAAAKTGARNAVYQLEMPIEEQALRFLASDSMVDSGNLMTGLMTHEEKMAIMASINRLKRSGTAYVDTDNASAEDILSDIEQSDYRVVMVDYLQLMDVNQGKNETRELAISRVAKDLKSLAKRKRITILTGSQLTDDGKLRESRAIGQHADKVLFVQKVEIDDEFDMTRRTLIVEKNRGGPPKVKIPLRFAGASFRFREAEQEDVEPEHWTSSMSKKKTR
jgi:replicative DNA helicase